MESNNTNQTIGNKVSKFSNSEITELLSALNHDSLTPEETDIRVYLLDEYEARHGEEAVDTLMDKMEAAA